MGVVDEKISISDQKESERNTRRKFIERAGNTLLMEKFKRWSFKGTFFFSKAIIIILAKERTQEGFEQSSYQKVCNFQSVDLCLIIYLPQQYLRGAKNRVNFLSVH